ncbi:hypothetical protein M0Q50_08785 [bacterium]|jgi:hypothetical protein|nr:hypothetical protein [bacterium]
MKIVKNLINEDIGGVGAPMSTVTNTPGMGNPIPATSTSLGSGDKWDNTINKKPYTQKGILNVKRKSNKKPIEESNINPYDKLGTSMAKKMKVKTPFRKIKSKSNQNSMKQRTFEHNIITFEEFLNESIHENEKYVEKLFR